MSTLSVHRMMPGGQYKFAYRFVVCPGNKQKLSLRDINNILTLEES